MTTGYTVAQQRWTCVELESGSEVMLGAHVLKPIDRRDGHSYIAVLMKEVDIDHPDITKLRIVGVRQGARCPIVKVPKKGRRDVRYDLDMQARWDLSFRDRHRNR